MKISKTNAETIQFLVTKMLVANSTSNGKTYDAIEYDCHSKALKAFLLQLLGEDLYNAIECLRYGFDWFDGSEAVRSLEHWINEVKEDKEKEENNKKIDYVVEYLTNGNWHTMEDLAQLTTFSKTEVEYIMEEHIFSTYEITMRRFDDGMKYKIIN